VLRFTFETAIPLTKEKLTLKRNVESQYATNRLFQLRLPQNIKPLTDTRLPEKILTRYVVWRLSMRGT
jgi:hypothetical protein